jgi:predicted RNase H-like nuclease (RuvC/YqgF family)
MSSEGGASVLAKRVDAVSQQVVETKSPTEIQKGLEKEVSELVIQRDSQNKVIGKLEGVISAQEKRLDTQGRLITFLRTNVDQLKEINSRQQEENDQLKSTIPQINGGKRSSKRSRRVP